MFPKKNRIKSSFFRDLFKKKKKTLNSSNLGLKIVENKGQINNYGVVVSKKAIKTAPDRNNMKRRILGVLNEQKTLILQGFTIIFYVKKSTPSLTSEELKTEIINLLKEAQIFKDETSN